MNEHLTPEERALELKRLIEQLQAEGRKDLLLKAGFTESDMPDLDLSALTKDTLITLFS